MQQARNITNALMYLRATYIQPRSLHSPYDYLARGTMYEWFHPNDNLKKITRIVWNVTRVLTRPHNMPFTR
jgi:hypothetical protein